MNFGQISILIAFLSSAAAAIRFVMERERISSPKQNQPQLKWGRNLSLCLYGISVAAGLVASAFLYYTLFNHEFKYSYVARYSSSDLSTFYLISSFWAGQEGTFLLWAVMVGVMGFVFIRSTKNEDGYALAIISAFAGFLYLLLLSKSPFDVLIPAPNEGNGLNPLLQDPWMVIHPPILFIGYAATIFPFALVVSGMMRRNYDNWFRLGLPWTLFSALTLGMGIIIGGFWAYEVLGWGGYWGWDPVENSSLVPWIILLALIHGMLIHKSRGSLQRTNIFFAFAAFIFVLYATFLTRSGILSNFSVHSFGDLGISNYLIGAIIVSFGIGFGLFIKRFGETKSPKIDHSSLNREVTLIISMYVLIAAAFFTFIGMSSPIITGLFGAASQVDTSFYNKVNLPVAIVISILLGITPLLNWTEVKKGRFLKRFTMPIVLTVIACVIAYTAGVTSWLLLLFAGSASFSLVSNIIIFIRQYPLGLLHIGGPISHIGVALFFIGIIGSDSFDESTQVMLKQNQPQIVYGYQFIFRGVGDQQTMKPTMEIEVSEGKSQYIAAPKLYYSDYNKAMMREPDIKVLPLKDLYISPLELQTFEAHAHNPLIEIVRGETVEFSGYKITFVDFDKGQHTQNAVMPSMGAFLNISDGKKTEQIVPRLEFNEKMEWQSLPVDFPSFGRNYDSINKPQVALRKIIAEEKRIVLELLGLGQKEEIPGSQALVTEINIKPLMMLVWTGVVLIMAGTAAAWCKRSMVKSA